MSGWDGEKTSIGSADIGSRRLEDWDSMFFETVDPTRMRRMTAILAVVTARSRGSGAVLDLGTGPGPLAARLLWRFPRYRVVAVDTDPVLLEVGRRALDPFGKRVTWVLTDLREAGWSTGLPVHRFEAVVSSLALHWLEEDEIRNLYRDLGTLLRPGGLLVNGDYLPSRRPKTTVKGRRRPPGEDSTSQRADARLRRFKREWKAWWGELRAEPSMQDAFRERAVRLPGALPPRRTSGPKTPASLEFHEHALGEAGFGGVAVTWRERDFRVLTGVR